MHILSWAMASSFHCTNSSINHVGITECSKLKMCEVEAVSRGTTSKQFYEKPYRIIYFLKTRLAFVR
jgi:hypothetical protein